jgi:hypothetical protein
MKGENKMTITAKYPGKCRKCGAVINIGDRIEWEKSKGAAHISCPAIKRIEEMDKKRDEERKNDPNNIKISGGSGYGCHGWTVGQTINHMVTRRREKGEILPNENPEKINPYWVDLGYQLITVITSGKRYYREDGMSFGVGDDSGYTYWADCRPATPEQISQYIDALMPTAIRENAKIEITKISKKIRDTGEYPLAEQINLEGSTRILNTQDIYGGGDWFFIGCEWIWYVRNNGGDGDDWSCNNVRTGGAGAIGWRIPYDANIASRLVECEQVLKGEK